MRQQFQPRSFITEQTQTLQTPAGNPQQQKLPPPMSINNNKNTTINHIQQQSSNYNHKTQITNHKQA
jgi:hypothetical protein